MGNLRTTEDLVKVLYLVCISISIHISRKSAMEDGIGRFEYVRTTLERELTAKETFLYRM